MDTILPHRSHYEKAATSAAGIGSAICRILSQNLIISAKDMRISSIAGISQGLSYTREIPQYNEQLFEQEILENQGKQRLSYE